VKEITVLDTYSEREIFVMVFYLTDLEYSSVLGFDTVSLSK
jgi:hypothetical protein